MWCRDNDMANVQMTTDLASVFPAGSFDGLPFENVPAELARAARAPVLGAANVFAVISLVNGLKDAGRLEQADK